MHHGRLTCNGWPRGSCQPGEHSIPTWRPKLLVHQVPQASACGYLLLNPTDLMPRSQMGGKSPFLRHGTPFIFPPVRVPSCRGKHDIIIPGPNIQYSTQFTLCTPITMLLRLGGKGHGHNPSYQHWDCRSRHTQGSGQVAGLRLKQQHH